MQPSPPRIQYAIYCLDGPNRQELRARNLKSHKCHIEHWAPHIIMSGPLLAADGKSREGQLYVIEVESADEARRFVHDDPFTIAKIFTQISIQRFSPRIHMGRRTKDAQLIV
ncbi:YciI family protein [Paenarthrobacter sp. A20]|nr:YciI family protein [Paenarthrobacter sp. A20]